MIHAESVVAGPTCDRCGRDAKLRDINDDSHNYEWVTPSSHGPYYTSWCMDVVGHSHHTCTVDNQYYVTKSFADLHPELVVA